MSSKFQIEIVLSQRYLTKKRKKFDDFDVSKNALNVNTNDSLVIYINHDISF